MVSQAADRERPWIQFTMCDTDPTTAKNTPLQAIRARRPFKGEMSLPRDIPLAASDLGESRESIQTGSGSWLQLQKEFQRIRCQAKPRLIKEKMVG